MGFKNRAIICGIYKITSPSGRIYIGQSIDIYKAWNKRYKSGHCKNQSKLFNSIKKYGWDSHEKEIIHQIEYNEAELNRLEKYYEELYDSTNPKTGLNLRKGGGSAGRMSEETRKKMSESHKGEKNYWFGKKLSEATREKMRYANSGERSNQFGKPLTPRQLEVLRKGRINLLMYDSSNPSPETRQKISQFHKGKKWSLGKKATEEQRKKMRERSIGEKNPFFGKKHTNESRQKVSATKSKIILNTQTGIFYFGLKEVSEVCGVHVTTLCAKLNGRFINNTSYIYA